MSALNTNNKSNGFYYSLLPAIVITIAGILLYINTIPNGYTFDDSIVVTANNYTKQGFKGIGKILTTEYMSGMYGENMRMYKGARYRPLSVVTFAIEYQFFGENAQISHAVNTILYGLTCLLLFLVLNKLFNNLKINVISQKWYFTFPFIVTLLWAAHPVHTEVIASIKGRDEIMAFLFSLLTLYQLLKYLYNSKRIYLILSGLWYFIALMSKENAITFLAIIPLSFWFFTSIAKEKYSHISIPLIISSIAFFVFRQSVVGNPDTVIEENIMTNSFIEASDTQKYATILSTLGIYLKLLIFPHPLTFDYYAYHIKLREFSDWQAFIPLLLYLFLGIYAILKLKEKNIISFCIIYYLSTLSIYSNIFFNIGVFMSERFLYFASLGFSIFFGYLVLYILPNKLKQKGIQQNVINILIVSLLLITSLLYSTKTISRNTIWKDNYTLFKTDAETSKNSFKSNAAIGEKYISMALREPDSLACKEYYRNAIGHFTKVVEVYPEYIYVLVYLGQSHYGYNQNIDSALFYYKKVLKLRPYYDDVFKNVQIMLKNINDADYQIKIYEDLYKTSPYQFDLNIGLGRLYGVYKNDLQKAILYLDRAVQLKPDNSEALTDLGVAYGMAGQIEKAITYFEKAYKSNSKNELARQNLIKAYYSIGQKDKAKIYEINTE